MAGMGMMANRFALLGDFDVDAYLAGVDAPLTTEGAQVTEPSDVIDAKGVKQSNVRAPRVDPVFDYDRSAKPLIVAPVTIVENVIQFPPIRISTVRHAKRASAMRRGRYFGTKDGPALIVYGSYADGSLQV